MSFTKELGDGMSAYITAHRTIVKYKLGKYLVLPGIISVAYVIVYFWIFAGISGNVDTDPESYPSWLSWVGEVLDWFLKAIYWVVIVWLFFATYKFVIQTILSPFLAQISDVTEAKLRGRKAPEINWKEYIDDLIRALRLAIRNLILELILCLFASFIPIIGFILVFCLSSYYTGFGYMDYTLERKRYSVRESIRFMQKHKGLTLGLGIPVYLVIAIPVVGWFIAPTYATVASTIAIMDMTAAPGKPQSPNPSNQTFEAV